MTRIYRIGSVAAAAAMVLSVSAPASATETEAEGSSVAITGAAGLGATILVDGTVVVGEEALAPVALAEDAQGDAAVAGAGLDFGAVSASTDLAAQTVTYSITTYDMPPGGHAPFYGYSAPIMVDGFDSTHFLATGNTGAGFPPQAGPFWALCRIDGGYICDRPLQGTMASNRITITLPFAEAGIRPGSVIETGGGVACEGLCSSPWAVLRFSDGTGGDRSPLAGFNVPGGVRLGIARSSIPASSITTDVLPILGPDGTWSASLTRPGPAGNYRVVARSCWGTVEAGTCAEASVTLDA
ncbi:MAG: hypothetical protein M3245_03065 [Actinomycetota bacterium]|nr:hypothetical protein [Actinomycetota bacterium]